MLDQNTIAKKTGYTDYTVLTVTKQCACTIGFREIVLFAAFLVYLTKKKIIKFI